MIKIAIPTFERLLNYRNAIRYTAEKLGIRADGIFIGHEVDGEEEGFEFPENFDVDDYDGLLLPGGADMDPAYYSESNKGSEGIDTDLDDFQLDMIDLFMRSGKPILGICRGHQVLNVFFGGSLIQDLPEKAVHKWLEHDDNVHCIRAEEGSILNSLYGEHFAVNSAHHQAVKVPGKGLRVTALSDDGIVEALEHESLPIFSTQYHPERMCYQKKRDDTVDGGPIFEYFLKKVQEISGK